MPLRLFYFFLPHRRGDAELQPLISVIFKQFENPLLKHVSLAAESKKDNFFRSGSTKTMSPFDSAQDDIVFVRDIWPSFCPGSMNFSA